MPFTERHLSFRLSNYFDITIYIIHYIFLALNETTIVVSLHHFKFYCFLFLVIQVFIFRHLSFCLSNYFDIVISKFIIYLFALTKRQLSFRFFSIFCCLLLVIQVFIFLIWSSLFSKLNKIRSRIMHETVHGKRVTEEELCILQIGPNTIAAEGTWVGGDIEVLFVCLHGRDAHWYTTSSGTRALNFDTFSRKFISSKYNNREKLKKFITVANHLDKFNSARLAIIHHLNRASRERLRKWRVIYLTAALLWSLSPDEVLEIVHDIQRDPKDDKDPKRAKCLATQASVVTRTIEVSERSALIVRNFLFLSFFLRCPIVNFCFSIRLMHLWLELPHCPSATPRG